MIMSKRRFARTGSPDYADRLAFADCQIDVAQDMHASRAAAETEVDAAHRDRRKHHCPEHLKTKPPSYGHLRLFVQALAFAAVLATASHAAAARTLRLVALGDSLTAGFGLAPGKAFPDRLEAALRAKGWDVKVINAGVSGDTAADGLARYDWSVPQDADALIIELGANDMLRGMKPERDEDDAGCDSGKGPSGPFACAPRRHAGCSQSRRPSTGGSSPASIRL